jgi:hypothetical protein
MGCWNVWLHKDSRLERSVSKRLTGLFSGHLPLDGASQRTVRHLADWSGAVWPFVVRKALRRLPNCVDQASFSGFAETDANRPIEADLFHHSLERLSHTGVPTIKTGGGHRCRRLRR